MPAVYVKPYVKRGKSDAVDAEAICEAVTRPTMRFVAVKSKEQQALRRAAYAVRHPEAASSELTVFDRSEPDADLHIKRT